MSRAWEEVRFSDVARAVYFCGDIGLSAALADARWLIKPGPLVDGPADCGDAAWFAFFTSSWRRATIASVTL